MLVTATGLGVALMLVVFTVAPLRQSSQTPPVALMSPVSVAGPAAGPSPGSTSVNTCTADASPHGAPASARRFISATEPRRRAVGGSAPRQGTASVGAGGVPEGRLVFDGACGFCTRSLGWLRRLDRRSRIEAVPFQSPGAAESVGATVEQCQAAVQWRGPDGRRRSGADAVNAALSIVLGTRVPSGVYALTRPVQERVYEWVAAHRGRFPGTSPHCSQHPADCGSPAP